MGGWSVLVVLDMRMVLLNDLTHGGLMTLMSIDGRGQELAGSINNGTGHGRGEKGIEWRC